MEMLTASTARARAESSDVGGDTSLGETAGPGGGDESMDIDEPSAAVMAPPASIAPATHQVMVWTDEQRAEKALDMKRKKLMVAEEMKKMKEREVEAFKARAERARLAIPMSTTAPGTTSTIIDPPAAQEPASSQMNTEGLYVFEKQWQPPGSSLDQHQQQQEQQQSTQSPYQTMNQHGDVYQSPAQHQSQLGQGPSWVHEDQGQTPTATRPQYQGQQHLQTRYGKPSQGQAQSQTQAQTPVSAHTTLPPASSLDQLKQQPLGKPSLLHSAYMQQSPQTAHPQLTLPSPAGASAGASSTLSALVASGPTSRSTPRSSTSNSGYPTPVSSNRLPSGWNQAPSQAQAQAQARAQAHAQSSGLGQQQHASTQGQGFKGRPPSQNHQQQQQHMMSPVQTTLPPMNQGYLLPASGGARQVSNASTPVQQYQGQPHQQPHQQHGQQHQQQQLTSPALPALGSGSWNMGPPTATNDRLPPLQGASGHPQAYAYTRPQHGPPSSR
jgi:hypothetical protein